MRCIVVAARILVWRKCQTRASVVRVVPATWIPANRTTATATITRPTVAKHYSTRMPIAAAAAKLVRVAKPAPSILSDTTLADETILEARYHCLPRHHGNLACAGRRQTPAGRQRAASRHHEGTSGCHSQ